MTDPEIRAILLVIPGLLLFLGGLRSRGTGALGLSFGFFAMALSALSELGFCVSVIIGTIVTVFVAWILE